MDRKTGPGENQDYNEGPKNTPQNPDDQHMADLVSKRLTEPEKLAPAAEELKDMSEEAGKTVTEEEPRKPEDVGALEKSLTERLDKFDESFVKKDKETIKGMTAEQIRKQSAFLDSYKNGKDNKEKITGIKEATARMIKAFTNGAPDAQGFFTLNYNQYDDVERKETIEKGVGLGDILLDPNITDIEIIKGGSRYLGKRAVIKSGRYRGRVGFVFAKDYPGKKAGKYMATHTGDKFRILSKDEVPAVAENEDQTKIQETYLNTFAEEAKKRESYKHRILSKKMGEVFDYRAINIPKKAGHELSHRAADLTKENIINKFNAQENFQGQGQKLFEYGDKMANKFNLSKRIYWAIIRTESGKKFDINALNPDSGAGGLAQWMPAYYPIDHIKKVAAQHPEWNVKCKPDPEGFEPSRFNPYVQLYLLGWQMDKVRSRLSIPSNMPIDRQAALYYSAWNSGIGGAKGYLNFFSALRKAGINTDRASINKFRKENPGEFNKIANQLHPTQLDRGVDDTLRRWFEQIIPTGVAASVTTIPDAMADKIKNANETNDGVDWSSVVAIGDSNLHNGTNPNDVERNGKTIKASTTPLPGNHTNLSMPGNSTDQIHRKAMRYLEKSAYKGDKLVINFGEVNRATNEFYDREAKKRGEKGIPWDPSLITQASIDKLTDNVIGKIDEIVAKANEKGIKIIAIPHTPAGKFIKMRTGDVAKAKLVTSYLKRVSDHIENLKKEGKIAKVLPFYKEMATTDSDGITVAKPEFAWEKNDLHLRPEGYKHYSSEIRKAVTEVSKEG